MSTSIEGQEELKSEWASGEFPNEEEARLYFFNKENYWFLKPEDGYLSIGHTGYKLDRHLWHNHHYISSWAFNDSRFTFILNNDLNILDIYDEEGKSANREGEVRQEHEWFSNNLSPEEIKLLKADLRHRRKLKALVIQNSLTL